MNRTKSTLGAKKLREWFRSPSRDRKLITQRQDIIEFLLKPRNSDLFARLTQCIKASKNLPQILVKMRRTFRTSTDHWNSIRQAVTANKPSGKAKKRSVRTVDMFYGNNHWFAFLRMHYLIYSRCKALKEWARYKELHEYDGFTKQDPHEEVAVIIKRKHAPTVEPAHLHKTFITYVEALLDNGIDSATYEDLLRDLYGPRAHEVFTIDRLIQNSMRQLHSLTTDEISRKLLSLYDYNQLCKETYPAFNPAVYRTNCEHSIRDDSLFSVEFRKFGALSEKISDARLRMLNPDETSSPQIDASTVDEEWSLYVSKYTDATTIAPPSVVPSIRRIPRDAAQGAKKRTIVEAEVSTGTVSNTHEEPDEREVKAARLETPVAAEVEGSVKTDPSPAVDSSDATVKPSAANDSDNVAKAGADASTGTDTDTDTSAPQQSTVDNQAPVRPQKGLGQTSHATATPVVMVTSEPVGITSQYVLSHIYHTQERNTVSTTGNAKGRGKVGRGGTAGGHHGNGRRNGNNNKDTTTGDSDAGTASRGNSRINGTGNHSNENEGMGQSNLLSSYTGNMLKVPVFLRRAVDTGIEKHVHPNVNASVAEADLDEDVNMTDAQTAAHNTAECTTEYRDGTDRKVSIYAKNALEVKMCINSYKLKYVTDTSDYVTKTRTGGPMRVKRTLNGPAANLNRWRRFGTKWLNDNKSTDKNTESLLKIVEETSQAKIANGTNTAEPAKSGS